MTLKRDYLMELVTILSDMDKELMFSDVDYEISYRETQKEIVQSVVVTESLPWELTIRFDIGGGQALKRMAEIKDKK